MRTKDTFKELEEISILCQYLYANENRHIQIDNGIAKLEVYMRDDSSFYVKNLNFPNMPLVGYTDIMTVPHMLGIIAQLKETSSGFGDTFKSYWEEICFTVASDRTVNNDRTAFRF